MKMRMVGLVLPVAVPSRGRRWGAVGLTLLLAGAFLAPPATGAAADADGEETAGSAARQAAATAILPPLLPWEGASRQLAVAADHPWVTPAEASALTSSPSYDDTLAWLRRLVAAHRELALVDLGPSDEGRTVWMVVASREGAATPEALRANGRPTVLAQAGIHAGEIDGKDAGMMLLRDLVTGGREAALLDGANLLFVPILNVDGHQRRSAFARPNQRGPALQGWRTNARNLNLNRDFAKLDASETRAVVAAIHRWQPDLYLDLHVTDGADYQYDITFGWHGFFDRAEATWSPGTIGWLNRRFAPEVGAALAAAGHVPGPLVFHRDPSDQRQGLEEWPGGPRFAVTWGEVRALASVLVENHSLKPFAQRVLGTRVLLAAAMRTLAAHGAELRQASAADRAARPDPIVLDWQEGASRPDAVDYLGIEQRFEPSAISGTTREVWTGRPVRMRVPVVTSELPGPSVARPRAWWVPPAWGEVAAVLAAHGIEGERTAQPVTLEAEVYRLEDARLRPSDNPYEGRAMVDARPRAERRRVTLPAGSLRVSADQPLATLAAVLLEPAASDSLFRWGFFLGVLQRTEYIESYVIEPMAEAMLAADPELARVFAERLETDPAFAADPNARLRFFYERTPFYDDRHLLYPVVRELAEGP
jgi:hypothetical protein